MLLEKLSSQQPDALPIIILQEEYISYIQARSNYEVIPL